VRLQVPCEELEEVTRVAHRHEAHRDDCESRIIPPYAIRGCSVGRVECWLVRRSGMLPRLGGVFKRVSSIDQRGRAGLTGLERRHVVRLPHVRPF
jgi:hypothetical protein